MLDPIGKFFVSKHSCSITIASISFHHEAAMEAGRLL
jgi:hypothetical protein